MLVRFVRTEGFTHSTSVCVCASFVYVVPKANPSAQSISESRMDNKRRKERTEDGEQNIYEGGKKTEKQQRVRRKKYKNRTEMKNEDKDKKKI